MRRDKQSIVDMVIVLELSNIVTKS